MQMRHIDAARFAISATRPRFLRESFDASRLRRMIIASSARRAFASAVKFTALKLDRRAHGAFDLERGLRRGETP